MYTRSLYSITTAWIRRGIAISFLWVFSLGAGHIDAQTSNAPGYVRDTVFVRYENLGPALNSADPDFCAVLNKNENLMVFTSRRKGNTGQSVAPYDEFPYEDIYVSRKDDTGEWSEAHKLKGKVNTGDHEAPVWLSEDGKTLFLYKYRAQGDIFQSDFDGREWSKPRRLRILDSPHRETHASMTADGKTIYFTSTDQRYGNYGGLDIFRITYNDQTRKWSKPQNLGPGINSPYNEECVTINGDGSVLYFSSEGHNSIGGYDIFISYAQPDGEWSAPVNPGYPINTPSNDIYIFLTADGKHAYLDSDRPGGFGEKDLYKVTFLNAFTIPATFRISDEQTGQNISATVTLQDAGSGENISLVPSGSGSYTALLRSYRHYRMQVEAAGHQTRIIEFNTKNNDLENASLNETVFLEPNRPSSPDAPPAEDNPLHIPVNADLTGTTAIIYFSFNSWALDEHSRQQLSALRDILQGYPEYRVEVTGHTDGSGGAGFNIDLSMRRSDAVAAWLIAAGIPSERIEQRWFGEDLPAVEEVNEDGSVNSYYRQLNRRVTLVLVK